MNETIIIKQEHLLRHRSLCDCWVSIFGQVYDITDFILKHPGGIDLFKGRCGKDITSEFRTRIFYYRKGALLGELPVHP